MKIFIIILGLIAAPIQARVNIFTCEPEWQSLANYIGGEKVTTFSATNKNQDPHYISARPNLISKISRSDMVFCTGADLEEGWLPILLNRARQSVQKGEIGNFLASEFIDLLDKPKIIDRSHGHIHAKGNPHIHLNPYNILKIAKEFTKRISLIDPQNKEYYQSNLIEFNIKLQDSIRNLEKLTKSLKGKKVITHHKSFTYLFKWLGVKNIGSLEPKPGVPPTIKHLSNLLDKDADFIIISNFEPEKAANWLSKKTGIDVKIIPYTSDNILTLFDDIIEKLNARN